jgi:hypothetical protein
MLMTSIGTSEQADSQYENLLLIFWKHSINAGQVDAVFPQAIQ